MNRKMDKCLITSAMGWDCDSEWGHKGDIHYNKGDGFYANDRKDEHLKRQIEMGNADFQKTIESDIRD